ncbi:MAG TPA: hypothetical protein VN903_02410 [Polyangia bacterium]|jgi:hypothetical protein|nr:hypothetical protein [Polyangia bacterium]
MAKRVVIPGSRVIVVHEGDRDLEAWRIADHVRSDLASGMLRLQVFEETHTSRAARQAAGFILAALSKLDELEEEGSGFAQSAVGARAEPRSRVGHG